MKENKWINGALPAILIHGSIGSVYAWSNFSTAIAEKIGTDRNLVQFAFSLAIFFLGMSAAFGGRIVERNIHISSRISLGFFCGGLFLTGFAIHINSLPLIYLSYGVIMGIGLGTGYLTPVKTLMLWFKDHKGLATGIAVCAFGFASLIANHLNQYLIDSFCLTDGVYNYENLHSVFVTLAIIYMIPMFIASWLLKKPSWWKEDEITNSTFKMMSMWKDSKFVKIWIIVFLNILCGISLVGKLQPFMTEIDKTEKLIFASTIVGTFGIFNGSGRIIVSTLSDKLKKRINIYSIMLVCEWIAVLLLKFNNPIVSYIALCIIATGYGAGFSCLPSLLSDIYGSKNISKIHGLSLTAWGIAGLVSVFISNINNLTLITTILLIGYSVAEVISYTIKYTNFVSADQEK